MIFKPPPDLEPDLALLLGLVPIHLSQEAQAVLRDKAREIEDWTRFLRLTARRMSAPMVYHHLSGALRDDVPPEVLAVLRGLALRLTMRSMELSSELSKLVRTVMEPGGIPYMALKGPATAAQFYPSIGLRPSRDIDILVPARHRLNVLERALAEGYEVAGTTLTSREEIVAYDLLSGDASLVSPSGHVIEVHCSLDKLGAFFDTDKLFEMAPDLVPVGSGSPIATLPIDFHFVYKCYHHTRHRWSHLHWLSDIDAVSRHPAFDMERVRRLARDHGLEATVLATAELVGLSPGLSEPWPREQAQNHAEELMTDIVSALRAEEGGEFAYRKKNIIEDVGYKWQKSDLRFFLQHAIRLPYAIRVRLRVAAPRYEDYERMPLARKHWWIYRVVRPVRLFVGMIGRRLPGRGHDGS